MKIFYSNDILIKRMSTLIVLCSLIFILTGCSTEQKRPNILFCLSDDQSYEHTGITGSNFISTPAFDRIASEGILFTNSFVSTPSCNPSRASVLTGMPFYLLKEASMNHTIWPGDLVVYTDVIEKDGYHVGYTGKGCAPTNWKAGGRNTNPAGRAYNKVRYEGEHNGVVNTNYAENFKQFLNEKEKNKPFCFWFGAVEPHRVFQKDIGLQEEKKLDDAVVPEYLPDADVVRGDLLDYAVHIEWFDHHLGKMIEYLEEIGELDNTLIVVTSDNGMAFPRAKASCYDSGTHVPLAIRWGDKINGGRVVADFVSHTDFAPTFYEVAEIEPPENVIGRSILPLLESSDKEKIGTWPDFLVTGVERHYPGSRKGGLGYPIRAIRTDDFLYIKNYAPDRFPAGDPKGPVWPADDPSGGFGDTDGSPTKTYIWENKDLLVDYYAVAFGKRPADELYDVKNDPYQKVNLANREEFEIVKNELRKNLEDYLFNTGDPRSVGKGHILDEYAVKAINEL